MLRSHSIVESRWPHEPPPEWTTTKFMCFNAVSIIHELTWKIKFKSRLICAIKHVIFSSAIFVMQMKLNSGFVMWQATVSLPTEKQIWNFRKLLQFFYSFHEQWNILTHVWIRPCEDDRKDVRILLWGTRIE